MQIAGRMMGWMSIACIGFILATNCLVMAESPTPGSGQPSQPAEQNSDVDTSSSPVDPAPQPVEQNSEDDISNSPVDIAPQPVEQNPEDDISKSLVDPAPQPAEQNPENEISAPPVDPVPQSTEQGLEVDVSASPVEPTLQPTEKAPEAETAAPADTPTPQNAKQTAKEEPAVAANTSFGVDQKSILNVIFGNLESNFTLTSGVRKDDFRWSIAGNSAGTSPNVLSELTWSDVDSYQITLANRTMLNRLIYIRGEVNYAFIQNGRVRDSDYNGDNRTDEYSRSISDCSGDQIWDVALGAGYPFYFIQERLVVAPLLGYSYHQQNFRVTDGEQVITWPGGPSLGHLGGLNSTYQSTWSGPWVGCDLRYRPSNISVNRLPMEFGFSVEYHYADYEAEANWNLRSDFQHPVSFEHEADGYGIALTGEWLINLSKQWDFVFRTTYQHWKTDYGIDRVYYSNNSVGYTRLNEVEWTNHSLMVGVNFHF